jgi:hypothetical protein
MLYEEKRKKEKKEKKKGSKSNRFSGVVRNNKIEA